jgi:hypothetical protein
MFFFGGGSQFCDKAKVAIIQRKIEPNLAINYMKLHFLTHPFIFLGYLLELCAEIWRSFLEFGGIWGVLKLSKST